MACVYRMSDNRCGKDSCEGYVSYCGFDDTSDCVWYKPSNADRFRAMPDEELAKFFDTELFLSPWCDMSCGYVEEAPCRQCMLKWLKQEADI